MTEFYLTCVGITIIITQSSIFEPIRDTVSKLGERFEDLIHCAMCTGFWVGLLLSLFFGKNVIYSSATSSLLSWAVYLVANFFITLTIYFQDFSEPEGKYEEQ